ncbi:MAG: hypothetical protein ABIA67_06345 [Candidatus Margulisiibacteriota bacterium]
MEAMMIILHDIGFKEKVLEVLKGAEIADLTVFEGDRAGEMLVSQGFFNVMGIQSGAFAESLGMLCIIKDESKLEEILNKVSAALNNFQDPNIGLIFTWKLNKVRGHQQNYDRK